MRALNVRILPQFEDDLAGILDYIAYHLVNPDAAAKLAGDVFQAIRDRALDPRAFEPVYSEKPRQDVYYPIRVRNYTIVYVVIDTVMEVRRIFYTPANWRVQL